MSIEREAQHAARSIADAMFGIRPLPEDTFDAIWVRADRDPTFGAAFWIAFNRHITVTEKLIGNDGAVKYERDVPLPV
jgi:hypothetical protein